MAWYRARSREVARGFVAVIDEGIRAIRERPEAWSTWRGCDDVRRRILPRFPYSIVYVIEDAAIVVVALAHHKRRPGYWVPRIGQ